MEDEEIIKEFLIESTENLARLDQDIVQLEGRPKDADLIASVFRTIHTIKGTSGMLGFGAVEGIAHLAENLLSRLRNGERDFTPKLASLILESVDAIKEELATIEATGKERGGSREDLRRRLKSACDLKNSGDPAILDHDGAEAEPSTPPAPNTDSPAIQKVCATADSTIRVDVGLLDRLMNLVGELVLARNQILQFNATREDSTLKATSQHLNLITTELQEGVMKTRMQPIGVVWNQLPRVVRDLAASSGKLIRIEMDGVGTELDKTIIEAIKDPLTHLVRNCCDHGIEVPALRARAGKPAQGTISLHAYHEGGQVNIEICDDGAGIDPRRLKKKATQKGLLQSEQAERMTDPELLELVFLPGFSTADIVTNISGRGVGMDVVKTNIEKIGGTVEVTTQLGQGTTFKVKIPLTLAIIPGLVVTSGGERFVIPQASLVELIRLEGEAGKKLIENVYGTYVYRRRGALLPIVHLNEVLKIPSSGNSDAINIVVLQAEDHQFGLVVDGINDTQEIVVKPLGKRLMGLNCYAGSTIMGDGRVALILDAPGIAHRAQVISEKRGRVGLKAEQKRRVEIERQSLLLFRSGRFARLAVPLSLVARLEKISQAKIEHAGGRLVVQYRGQLLPLACLFSLLQPGAEDESIRRDPVQVIIFSDGNRSLGIVVDEILDIVEDSISVQRPAGHAGLLGSAVVGGLATDFLDLHAVVQAAGEDWFGESQRPSRSASVLLADGSAFSRGLVRNYLEIAGHRVLEASDTEQALGILRREHVDVIAASVDLPSGGGPDLLECIGQEPDLKPIPALALSGGAEDVANGTRQRFKRCEVKFDRHAVLRSLEELTAADDPLQFAATEGGPRS